jgi:hypothetical protein
MSADVLSWALSQPAGSRYRVLAEAYTTGAEEVVHEGARIRYRSREEMMEILGQGHAAGLTDSSRRPSVTYARFSRGW